MTAGKVPARSRLSRSDWTDAALRAMAAGGTVAVNVEQLAAGLDATKGSFYHHFENRQALLQAALARWEEIVEADLVDNPATADPRQRLTDAATAGLGTGLDGFVDVALAGCLDDPGVAASLRRVTERRIEWLTAALAELGVEAAVSRDRAVGGLAAYMGLYLWQQVSGERLSAEGMRAQLDRVIAAMVAN